MATLKNSIINDSGFLQLPSGSDAQRPENPEMGQIRLNTDTDRIEIFDGTVWKYLSVEVIPPTYSVTDSNTSTDEGTTITFEVTTNHILDGTTLYYTLSGVDSNDVSTPTSGNFTINGNSGSVDVTLTNDETTEGPEILTFQVRTDSTSGTIVASDTTTINDTSVSLAMAATGGTLTTTTIDGNPYNVHTFTSVGTTNFQVTTSTTGADMSPEIYMWGAGGGGGYDRGGRGTSNFTGGGGAGVYAKLELSTGTYTVSVGGAGGGGASGCIRATGGGSAGSSSTGHSGGRGGHPSNSGCSSAAGGGGAGTAFLDTDGTTELVVAGGGGGGGAVETGSIGSGGRGGGGGQNGQAGAGSSSGGTTGGQSTGVGQTPATPGPDQQGVGAGGGGYRGGNHGGFAGQDSVASGGGGGGSSYVTSNALASTISNGNFSTPGDSSNSLRGSAGNGGIGGNGGSNAGGSGQNGKVVIRYRTA